MTTEGPAPATGVRRALVLSGGGARGAYEAGILAYIFQELPQELHKNVPIRILCGTSVGAVHACFLAGNAHLPRFNIGRLLELWRGIHLDRMLRIRLVDLLRIPRDVRALMAGAEQGPGVLLNSKYLQEIVVRETPWVRIRRNVRSGVVQALTVSATHIHSGKTVVFVDRHGGGVPPWSRDQRVLATPARIGPLHAMASAAIPFMFPAIAIDGAYYCDGGLRQNTPLSPALRSGADRVLLMGLRNRYADTRFEMGSAASPERYPPPLYMLGKLLNSLLIDRLDYDLQRLEGFNTILRDGQEAFGEEFIDHLSASSQKFRGQSYRDVQTTYIRPSRDIGAMASEFVQAEHPRFGGTPGWLLSKLAEHDSAARSDLMSYLLFDGKFAQNLIALGMADADAARGELIAFLKD